MQIKQGNRTIEEIIKDGEHQDEVDTIMEAIHATVKKLEDSEYSLELIYNSMLYTGTQLFLDQFKDFDYAKESLKLFLNAAIKSNLDQRLKVDDSTNPETADLFNSFLKEDTDKVH
tara:strand:- start:50 stop:397 length:348 start_codon:yes stop_codon:yes gene_type:complete